ncbi:sensor domain-containing diguanylate cyclase [Bacillus sp. JCM 19034]|uniref:sensor domain-containing diguanylate cyclase n=1 Tax=Bacillus sp. JCM 19034 TaxID=1481928 RepID=UPI0009EB4820|nr:sensor domain-containing diguanylate cyclase [Bacillus sp. JCM 19034]
MDKGLGSEIEDGFTIDLRESYCQQIFLGNGEPLLINDAFHHPFTSHLPLTSKLKIQSYIGVPIFYQDGEMFGTLCALDNRPDRFSNADMDLLTKCANLITYVIELEKKSTFDSLTNLYNRSYLYDHFESSFNQGTILLLDLDGFKEVNDNYGHDVGDTILNEVGIRIKMYLSDHDIAVRLGGDEFVIILNDVIEEDKINELTKRLISSISNWNNFEFKVNITVSIGVVRFPQDGLILKTLLKKADNAMYEAKKSGKNRCVLYPTKH